MYIYFFRFSDGYRVKNKKKKRLTKPCNLCFVPCVAAVPMVEAMVALVLMDQLMAQNAQCNLFPLNQDLQEPLELPKLFEDDETVLSR